MAVTLTPTQIQARQLALTAAAHKALLSYVERADNYQPEKFTVFQAVVLTTAQQDAIASFLRKFRDHAHYACPAVLDMKPLHGYRSRVQKDCFSSLQYVEWLVAGCSDIASVSTDPMGRPQLVVAGIEDERSKTYDLL